VGQSSLTWGGEGGVRVGKEVQRPTVVAGGWGIAPPPRGYTARVDGKGVLFGLDCVSPPKRPQSFYCASLASLPSLRTAAVIQCRQVY